MAIRRRRRRRGRVDAWSVRRCGWSLGWDGLAALVSRNSVQGVQFEAGFTVGRGRRSGAPRVGAGNPRFPVTLRRNLDAACPAPSLLSVARAAAFSRCDSPRLLRFRARRDHAALLAILQRFLLVELSTNLPAPCRKLLSHGPGEDGEGAFFPV